MLPSSQRHWKQKFTEFLASLLLFRLLNNKGLSSHPACVEVGLLSGSRTEHTLLRYCEKKQWDTSRNWSQGSTTVLNSWQSLQSECPQMCFGRTNYSKQPMSLSPLSCLYNSFLTGPQEKDWNTKMQMKQIVWCILQSHCSLCLYYFLSLFFFYLLDLKQRLAFISYIHSVSTFGVSVPTDLLCSTMINIANRQH